LSENAEQETFSGNEQTAERLKTKKGRPFRSAFSDFAISGDAGFLISGGGRASRSGPCSAAHPFS